jgi:hypothetical protein
MTGQDLNVIGIGLMMLFALAGMAAALWFAEPRPPAASPAPEPPPPEPPPQQAAPLSSESLLGF